MAIYSGFAHEKLWFSIAMLVYQRVNPCVLAEPPRSFVMTPLVKNWGLQSRLGMIPPNDFAPGSASKRKQAPPPALWKI